MNNTRTVFLGIGLLCIMIGFIAIATGAKVCRTSCWIDQIFKLLLPTHLVTWAGGISWLILGIGVTIFGLVKFGKK